MMYYTTVSLLYRPLDVSAKVSKSPRYQEYLNVCRVAAKSIIVIGTQKLEEIVLLPRIIIYFIWRAFTSLSILKPIDKAHRPSIKSSIEKLFHILSKLEICYLLALNMKLAIIGLLHNPETMKQFDFIQPSTSYTLTTIIRNYDQPAIDFAYATVLKFKEVIDSAQVNQLSGSTTHISKMNDANIGSSIIDPRVACLSSDTDSSTHSGNFATPGTGIANATTAATSATPTTTTSSTTAPQTSLINDLIITPNMPNNALCRQYSSSSSSLPIPNTLTPNSCIPYNFQRTLSAESGIQLHHESWESVRTSIVTPNVSSLATLPLPVWLNANTVFSNNAGNVSDGSSSSLPPVITSGQNPSTSTHSGPMLMPASLSGQENFGKLCYLIYVPIHLTPSIWRILVTIMNYWVH